MNTPHAFQPPRRPIIAFVAVVLCIPLWFGGTRVAAAEADFATWLDGVRAEALKKGISDEVLGRALGLVAPIKRVIELDRRQPEFTMTLWRYFSWTVNDKRIARGREMLKKHATLLGRVEKKFGVQARFLVAFWGLETNFGSNFGAFPMVGAVATLAHDARRSSFFRAQLIAALQIIQRGDVAHDAKASWAGAMGNMQFIPTTYRDFAIDFDGDGKRDLWNSLPDVFGSAANYLKRSGWDGKRTWGREVKLPKDFDPDHSGLDRKRPLAEWKKLGLRKADGKKLPTVDVDASLVLPAGMGGPAFLVYRNFHATMAWNRSILYALAIGHLADRLAGGPALSVKAPKGEKALARRDVMEIQRLLTRFGFDTGGADGVAGPMTRRAIKGFQKSRKLPADGYAGYGLLERLRTAASN